MKCFSLSAFADECAVNAQDQLAALTKLGIGAIELRALNGKNVSELSPEEIKGFASAAKHSGIRVSAVGSPIGKIGLSEDRRAHFDMAKRIFEYAAALQTPYVRVFSFYLPDGAARKDCFSETVSALGELTELAKPFGVTLCHENEARIYGESPEDCAKLLEALPSLGCVFDMGNFALGGYAPIPAYELLKNRITYFHIKDGTLDGKIVPAGYGDAAIGEILSRYKKEIGRPTFVTLEPHLMNFAGLKNLTAQKHDTPFRFETEEEAFFFAAGETEKILERIDT